MEHPLNKEQPPFQGTDNAEVIGTGVQDPKNNFAFEVHQYLDQNGSGTSSASCRHDKLACERLHGHHGVGERRPEVVYSWAKSVSAQDQTSL